MPGLPPRYTSKPGDEESLPLKHDTFDEDELDRVPTPTYPPRHSGPSGGGQVNVRYTFNPRWPVPGKSEDALGLLGANKEATIDMVQRIFAPLAPFPAHRIEFLVPVSADSNDKALEGKWCKVMDEAWAGFTNDPPQRLIVQVADLPGQEAQRTRRKTLRDCSIISAILISPFAFFGFIALMVYFFGN